MKSKKGPRAASEKEGVFMRIQSSTVSMRSSRKSRTETERTRVTTDRSSGGGPQRTVVTVQERRGVHTEESAGASLFRTETGVENPAVQERQAEEETWTMDQGTLDSDPNAAETMEAAPPPGALQAPPEEHDWFGEIMDRVNSDPRLQIYRHLLELLDRVCGGKGRSRDPWEEFCGDQERRNPLQLSASAASARYQQTMSFFGVQLSVQGAGAGTAAPADISGTRSVNGYWLRQVKESGFVHGEEHTSFSSVGTAVTADGRTLDFGISVEMSRSFTEAYQVTGKTEVFTDPLVINLDTQDASLSDLHFFFDLDCDGEKEELSGLDASSGFLALDKNGDGEINDGSELFGARTGDGFRELAQYDQDGNGWIDENDEIFSKLSVWVQCGNGQAKLLSLADANVGAIFLGSRDTQFSLADSSGDVGAMARRTGIYLKETGEAGTVQHLDFKT